MARPAGAAAALVKLALGALMAGLVGCASLPEGVARAPSSTLPDTADTRLGRALAAQVAAHPGQTGVFLLGNGRDAFAARVLLARAADRSLDVQYYIWHGDTTGRLLGETLWEAAERGVRVRLLLDDNNTHGMDDMLAVLDAHPGIEVRLFNPYANRDRRLVELVTDFARVNRRMHNKSFTADNQATIVGGRNIGDEYFGAGSPVEFADLDALAAGAAVRDVSSSFDAYWNSASAYPAASLFRRPSPGDAVAPTPLRDPTANQYLETVRDTPLVQHLLAGSLPLDWSPAHLVSDDPEKVRQPPERTEMHMLPRLERAIGKPVHEFDLVSPYFVPTKDGVAALVALVGRGVKVRVLTNSLAATDVLPVHAGYAKHRETLLRAGIRLYEVKPGGDPAERRPERDGKGIGGSGSGGGSSDVSLHAKTFVADRNRVFIGSFNFDPRSARLNTEMGIVLESVPLASRIAQTLDASIARIAYEVRLGPEGLEWVDGDAVHRSEPGTGPLRQMGLSLLSILPIDWLL